MPAIDERKYCSSRAPSASSSRAQHRLGRVEVAGTHLDPRRLDRRRVGVDPRLELGEDRRAPARRCARASSNCAVHRLELGEGPQHDGLRRGGCPGCCRAARRSPGSLRDRRRAVDHEVGDGRRGLAGQPLAAGPPGVRDHHVRGHRRGLVLAARDLAERDLVPCPREREVVVVALEDLDDRLGARSICCVQLPVPVNWSSISSLIPIRATSRSSPSCSAIRMPSAMSVRASSSAPCPIIASPRSNRMPRRAGDPRGSTAAAA